MKRPVGVAALGLTVLVWLAEAAGINLPPEVAAAIVGLVAAGISIFTPRI